MPYTILIPPQITPATVTRPGAQGGVETRENPERVQLPLNTVVLYRPPLYNRFSADPALRSLLLQDPAGTATLAQVTVAFPAYIAALDLKTDKETALAAVNAAVARLQTIEATYPAMTAAQKNAALTDMAKFLRHIIRLVA